MQSKTCKTGESCIGGLARISTVIKTLFEHRKDAHPIYLNAGDNFQGTLFYTLGRWDITQHFMNLIRPDAMVCIICVSFSRYFLDTDLNIKLKF